jgi:uncharacterized protein (DUF305 family)
MKTTTWLALLAALGVVALAAIATGCGDDATSAGGNSTDAAFIADMTVHHEGAIEMARLARAKAEHPEIRSLADDIIDSQEGEISVMRAIRRDMPDMDTHGDGHMGMSDSEMGMDMDPAMLEDADPFDRAFIDMMIPHHQGAIAMAKDLLEKGEQPALRDMAEDIIDAQAAEIERMRKWRKDWYGSAAAEHGTMHGDG